MVPALQLAVPPSLGTEAVTHFKLDLSLFCCEMSLFTGIQPYIPIWWPIDGGRQTSRPRWLGIDELSLGLGRFQSTSELSWD